MMGRLAHRGTPRHRARSRITVGIACSLLVVLHAATAGAQTPPYPNDGLRWIGSAAVCQAPVEWTAQRLFHTPQLPDTLANLCLYIWRAERTGPPPTPAQVADLFSVSKARGMTEDVPVVSPSAPPDETFLAGLRGALRRQVGDATLLPVMPRSPTTRIVVIDSAPDATAGHIQPGASRHGDTIAHLIEDLVCLDTQNGRACAAEVTTALALPWIARGKLGPHGGHVGSLADVARAIERAVDTWRADRNAAPMTTPPRLLLNLSLGWEHTAGIADCMAAAPQAMGAPAAAVIGMLGYATAQGALIVAAAGNDSAGPIPRTGLVCPGRYQQLPATGDPSRSLVIAVSGVDYQDHPLETARPLGATAITALGLGGVAWQAGDPVPPALTGSSVSAAVVSAVSALVWAANPTWSPGEVTGAVYQGGTDVGAADECPVSIPGCRSRRASVCGALNPAGAHTCAPPPPLAWSCPSLPTEIAALRAAYSGVPPNTGTILSPGAAPRFVDPTVQTDPWTFPQPISATCPTCWVESAAATVPTTLTIPAVEQDLLDAMLVVQPPSGPPQGLALGDLLAGSGPIKFALPASWIPQSAYVSGFDGVRLHSVTAQIFVQQ